MKNRGIYSIVILIIRNGRENAMTLIKEKAVEMIRRMPEDHMIYVVNILQNLEAMSIEKGDKQKAKEALTNILGMEKRLPEDFDLKKELQEARTEKYDNFS